MNEVLKTKFSIGNTVTYSIVIGVLIVTFCFVYNIYKANNFNKFQRSERIIGISEFKRDNKVKYSDKESYEIISDEYNDAMFYETIKTKENTPYRVTCMVKTENIEKQEENKAIGAQIATDSSTERSVAISGTSDWQKIEFIFNSKNRTEINIGFRLGGNAGLCKGKAWFSDFTIEEGTAENNNEWKFACFIFKTTDVNINGKEIKISAAEQDIENITDTIERFSKTCKSLSNSKMQAECDIYTVDTPITSLSYDEKFGYYVSAEDIEDQIKNKISENDYDHIFIVAKLGDEKHKDDIEINDWIGLGSMDYYGIGFSNIRLPNEAKSYVYKYDSRVNIFPEEVFLHEFLHSLERNSQEYGYQVPALHDYEKYGYKDEMLIGQRDWYDDYMNKNIKDENGNYIGLPSEIYKLKPAKSSNFKYSTFMEDVFVQPTNIFESVKELIENISTKFHSAVQGE